MSGKEKTFTCFSKCGFALIISALAELKAFFLFFVLITIIATFITSFSKRKLLLIIIGVIFLSVGIALLETVFSLEGEFTFNKILELITSENYSSKKDVGRLTAIPTLAKTILTEPIEQLFGLGLGNCDSSEISFFNTPFYDTYRYLHYHWFSSAFLFLETGIIGFAIYLLFFVFIFVYSCKNLKNGTGNKLYCQMAIILTITSIILTFYNGSLRTEAGYIMFFALALPFIERNEEVESNEEMEE
jgi:O-antigen ligase